MDQDRMAQWANDLLEETGREYTPWEIRSAMEYSARFDIELWLLTGRTDHFNLQ